MFDTFTSETETKPDLLSDLQTFTIPPSESLERDQFVTRNLNCNSDL